MIQIKDLQFPRYFLLHELDIDPSIASQLLEIKVEVRHDGEPDTAHLQGTRLIVSQPSSPTRFLFNVLYHLVKGHTSGNFQQDKLSLGLLFACKDYTYSSYEVQVSRPGQPPVLLDLNKLPVPSTIIENLVEPLVGKVKKLPVMFMKSNFVDCCELMESAEKFAKRFRRPFKSVSFHDYPFFMVNAGIHNEAAKMSHLTYKSIEHTFGPDRATKTIRNIILSDNSNITANLVEILKILEGDPIFIMDFLKFFKSNVTLTTEEETRAAEVRTRIVESDKYLGEHIKTAQSPKYTPHIFKQWHEWSMIVGLIEKQLAPMRGSMWPASEHIKPIEDEHRQLEVARAKEKGKTQLNFEELLELAREWYGHKTTQPGELAETLLRENRVWK